MDLTDVYRIFHPATTQYTFFSAAHGTFSKAHYILRHKANLNKCKTIEITLAYYPITIQENWNSTTKVATENKQTIGG
jgi:hypothetical protein